MSRIDSNKWRKWVIYRITSPTGKVYIGRTCNYKNRMAQYIKYGTPKSQPRLWNSFEKHGRAAHVFDIIDEFYGTIDDVASKEMFWIRSYMSNICKWRDGSGLNLTDGGEGALGYRHSKEAVEKMAARFRGKKLTPEHRAKIAVESKKRGNMKKGTKQSQETKEKIRDKMLGKKRTKEDVERRIASFKRNRQMKAIMLAKPVKAKKTKACYFKINVGVSQNAKIGQVDKYLPGTLSWHENQFNRRSDFCKTIKFNISLKSA